MSPNPYVFVVGCPRSGTTLLQRMLDAHPQLTVANDSHFVPKALEEVIPQAVLEVAQGIDPPLTSELVEWVRTYRRFTRFGLSDAAVYQAAAQARTYGEFVSTLFGARARLHGKRLAGEKTPVYVRYLPLLHALFPWVKSIHIIRDGRDVALSTLEWAKADKGPGRYGLWREQPLAVCALWWRWNVATGRRDGWQLGPAKHCAVKYEDLVAQPEQTLSRLADFLALPCAREMLDYYVGKTRHDPGLSAKQAWLPPTRGLRDWRTQMSPRDVELFEAIAGDLLSTLGYERRYDRITPDIAAVAERCQTWWQDEMTRRRTKRPVDYVLPIAQSSGRFTKPVLPAPVQEPGTFSEADADLVRRDPAIPGLATVLNPDAFVAALRPFVPEADLSTAQITYVKYKPGTNCLVGYRLALEGTTVEAYAKAYRPEFQAKLQKVRGQSSVGGPLGPGRLVLDQQAIVVSIFPNDSKLKVLPQLADQAARVQLFRELLPDQPDLWHGTVQSIRYKPERRFVAQWMANGRVQAALKVYAETGYHKPLVNANTFESRGALRVAQLCGSSDRRRILAFEWLPGRLLSEQIYQAESAVPDLSIVGAALAEVHAQSGARLELLTRESEAAVLFSVADGIAFLSPSLSQRVHDVARRLATQVAAQPPLYRPIHGDFYARQVLVDSDTVGILDLDEARLGDPAADLGNFIAHLESDALRGRLAAQRVEPLRDSLLEGYRALDPARVNLHAAIGLFRLLPHPFRQREADWLARTEAILERIEAILHTPSRSVCLPPSWTTLASGIPVIDPFGVAADPKMSFLAPALNPTSAQRQFERCLASLAGKERKIQLRAIRVTRYKPERRCLVEYDVDLEPSESLTLVGKARAKGLDTSSYNLLRSLWNTGFGARSVDGISVPEPIAVIAEWQMWLQSKVPGTLATQLLAELGGVALARRIAEAVHKLHQAGIPASRRHTVADELRILHERLSLVAHTYPQWAKRLERLLDACTRLGARLPESGPVGSHRDFYADHVIVDGARLSLVDFDLYCEADAGLDVGNFNAHLTEQSLRTLGDPCAMANREQTLEERFVELAGEATRAAVRTYATLSLVRHIHLSTLFPDRRPFTEKLLDLCEQRLLRATAQSRTG